jgi:hypothetical protein
LLEGKNRRPQLLRHEGIPHVSLAKRLSVLFAILTVSLVPPPKVNAQAPAVQEPTADSGEVAIQRGWFGVGNYCRPGEWTGIQLRINDSNDKPREVLIRISTVDADSDRPGYETLLTTNPGVNQPVWTYLWLPARFKSSDPLRVNVYAANEAPAAIAGMPVAAGRLLGTTILQPHQMLSTSEGMLGIVGNRLMGLNKYAGIPNTNYLPGAHERLALVERIDPDTLPDRWHGLSQFAALVWNEPPPSALSTEKAQAIREYVQRGGHLIIVLPRLAQVWTDEASNPLFDIVPRVHVNRREGVDLEPLRHLITHLLKVPTDERSDRLDMPTNEVLQTFVPVDGATPYEAACIISMPEDPAAGTPEWLVARRLVGAGMVTLVGLDCASSWMNQRALPNPELFWHRILGRRGQMVSLRESGDLTANYPLGRQKSTVDNSFADQIAKTTLAGAGVLMGLVVFVLYWLVAGPLGYAALKKTGRQRHAWVAFVLAAGVFTGIAWGGATIIRPAKISAAHLTIMDHIYTPEGTGVQRARSWMSVLIPQYGEAAIAVGDPTKAGSKRFHNLIAPWERENQSSAGFPDARGYRINSRDPDNYSVPTRSTVKQFQVDWAGGPVWKMPSPGADASGKIIELTAEPIMRGTSISDVKLTGSLTHDLPEALRSCKIVVNLGQRDVNRSRAGSGARSLVSDFFVVTLDKPWEPGFTIDLAALVKPASGRDSAFSPGDNTSGNYFGQLLSSVHSENDGRFDSQPSTSLSSLIVKMDALAFLNLIEPPTVEERPGGFQGKPLVARTVTHGWDLSHWATQPCIIITGYLGHPNSPQAPCPIPVNVSTGGAYRPVPTQGLVFVRWVYPLPPKPPAYSTPSKDTESPPKEPV